MKNRNYNVFFNLHTVSGIVISVGLYIIFFGVVRLFFLFATVTGVIVHWKKIVSNFYVFRPKEKLKTVWTDAHTALGTVGIPFQFMYALTGAMFGLSILAALAASSLFGGNTQKVYDELYGVHSDSLGQRASSEAYSLNAYFEKASKRWPGVKPRYVSMQHCESTTMHFAVHGNLSSKVKFLNSSEVVYNVASGKVEHEHDPYHVPYSEGAMSALFKLHFADFADSGALSNYLLRFIYFILAVATGFVIITGVLIWLEARNKKNISEKEKRFNQAVGNIYLAICLSMLPITAFAFIVAKLLPESVSGQRETTFNTVYFGGWLLLSVFFSWKRDDYFTNKQTLLWGGILGALVPVVNGVHTGNWPWRTWSMHQYDIFMIDALWLFLSVICIYAVGRLRQPFENAGQERRAKPVAVAR